MFEFNLGVALKDVDKASEAIRYGSSLLNAKTFAMFDFTGCDSSDVYTVCCCSVTTDIAEVVWYAGKKFGQLVERELVQEGSGGSDKQS